MWTTSLEHATERTLAISFGNIITHTRTHTHNTQDSLVVDSKVRPTRGTSGRQRGTTTSVSLTALVVLVAASLVASAQAQYSCTDPVLCQYGVRNDKWCSSSSSTCVNGKWKTYCVRGTEPRKTICMRSCTCTLRRYSCRDA